SARWLPCQYESGDESHRQTQASASRAGRRRQSPQSGGGTPQRKTLHPKGRLPVQIARGKGSMDPENAGSLESRTPTRADLLKICRSLNAHEAKYLVVGGFALIEQG